MSNRRVISLAAIVAFGIACISADALAARVAARGAVGYHGGALGYRGAWYGRGYYRPGLGLAAGALAGGAIAASSPWYGYGYGYGGYGYGGYGYGYGGYGYSNSYGSSDASTSGPGYSTRFIDSRTKAYYDDYCKQRFKKYDSSSGTYLGDDGVRHSCP
jgi:hypothetical protein